MTGVQESFVVQEQPSGDVVIRRDVVPAATTIEDVPDTVFVAASGSRGPEGPSGPSGGTGPQGPQGLQGPAGPAGQTGDTFTYTHMQLAPSVLWTVAHNLNGYPSVTVTDSAGSKVEGEVTYLDANTVQVVFSSPFAGEAFLS